MILLLISIEGSYGQVIVIDPGHGGEDTGAKSIHKGKTVYEKDLGLIYAKSLQEELKKNYTIYLTRSIDRRLGLLERTDISQKVNADLFISIHLNSSKKNGARGIEVYYLDNHNDLAVKKVEEEENRSFLDEDPTVDKILIDIIVAKTVAKSKELGMSVYGELKKGVIKKHKLRDRGVKAGLFYVLALAQRPSILVEIGFMSDSSELERLILPSFQKDFAQSLSKGLVNFFKSDKMKSDIPLL